MRIALIVTCLTDTLFPATGQATVRLLERLGHQVEFPEGQTCCGQMLRKVRGLELAELPAAETCCGFGGTFSVKNPDVSAAMCANKVAAIQQSRVEVLCAADNSCLMHIGGAMTRQRAGVSVMHRARSWPAPKISPQCPAATKRRSPHEHAHLPWHAALPGGGEGRARRFPGGGRVRGQRPDVRDAARDADLGGRGGEDPAVLPGPGGVGCSPSSERVWPIPADASLWENMHRKLFWPLPS